MPFRSDRVFPTALLAVASVLLRATPAFAQAAPAGQPSDHAWVDTVFKEFNADGPGCTVGAARHGRTVLTRSYGLANLEARRPNSASTPYQIASTAKQFTAMAIVLLAQDGRLSFDDDVRRWVPELPDYGQKITIRHLLNHTSGIRDYPMLYLIQRGSDQMMTDGDAMAMIRRQRRLNFDPGTDWTYSNSGYTLLSQVVQRVTGRTLSAFAHERIFAPLGMTSTTFGERRPQNGLDAVGYMRDSTSWKAATVVPATTGSGNSVTTVGDLLRWADNFRTGKVGGKAAVDTMQTPLKLADGSTFQYGFGLDVGPHRGTTVVAHGGGFEGYSSYLLRYPQHELAVAVLCNADRLDVGSLAFAVGDRLLEGELEPVAAATATAAAAQPATVPVSAADLAKLAGVYVSNAGQMRTFFVDSGTLRLRSGRNVLKMAPLGNGRFQQLPVRPTRTTIYHFTPGQVRRELTLANPVVFRYVGEPSDTTTASSRYVGRYESPELGATWEVRVGDDREIRVIHAGPHAPEKPDRLYRHGFAIRWGLMEFTTGCRGEVTGFTFTNTRVQQLRFDRLGVRPSGAACPAGTGR